MNRADRQLLWEKFDGRAWTDDWADLCDELGVEYRDGDLNSRELRKRVLAWVNDHDGWERVYQALRKLESVA